MTCIAPAVLSLFANALGNRRDERNGTLRQVHDRNDFREKRLHLGS